MKKLLVGLLLMIMMAGCGKAAVPVSPTSTNSPTVTLTDTSTILPTETLELSTETPVPSATPDLRLPPDKWQDWPVVPETVSPRTAAIYAAGQKLGNNPHAFSKIGDCESTPTWFLGAFDGSVQDYSLGSYTNLQEVIDYFHGSFGRMSLAVGRGFSSANALSPLWADPKTCEPNESPLACEVRVNRPAFALIMLGTNDVYHLDVFQANMHTILDFLIQKGVVPILSTKADNLEKNNSVNEAIAELAHEYDIPLWNFWRAVQPLPKHGLQEDGSHLTVAGPFFDDPARMKAAWPWRNLTALQVLDMVWRGVGEQP